MNKSLRSSRYFTAMYSSVYATYLLERSKYIKRISQTKKYSKNPYEIISELPNSEQYASMESMFLGVDVVELMFGVYEDLSSLAKRSLRKGAILIRLKSDEQHVEAVEEDMVYLENRAKEIQQIAQHYMEITPYGDRRAEYRPDPDLLYNRRWPSRRRILVSCITRLEAVESNCPEVGPVLADLRGYTADWEKKDLVVGESAEG